MDYESTIEIAQWLGKDKDVLNLQKLKEFDEKKRFCVTVWGHYSAGKSRLINNIINRNLLPVQARETTALLTYIQYGENEQCAVVYQDGTVINTSIEILKRLFQNGEECNDLNKVDHVEVYLNNELLRSGVVIVDTPGVNTVIQKHQDLAVDAIEQSGRILYVLGNGPSNIDRQFIKQISSCGINISFIRTKCDRFVESEESAELSLRAEKDEIVAFIGHDVEFIPVSNESKNKWFENIEKVRELIKSISVNIQEEMNLAFQEKLNWYGKQYKTFLKKEEMRIKEVLDGNMCEISKEISDCENELKRTKKYADDVVNRISLKVEQSKESSKRELDDLVSKSRDNFELSLRNLSPENCSPDDVKTLYNFHLGQSIEKMQKLLNSYFEEIVKGEIGELVLTLPDIINDFPVPSYTEIQQDNSRYLELFNSRLLGLKQELERIKSEKDKVKDRLELFNSEYNDAEYDEAINMLEKNLLEIPSGMALRVADNQEIQPSTVFKAVGDAADIALLLIPGTAIANGIKGVANTTKLAQTMHKLGKAGEVLGKAGKVVGNHANAIDRARDTAYALNTVLKKRRYSTQDEKDKAQRMIDSVANLAGEKFDNLKENKESGSVLDALSVAYWTEKLGKTFDSPPKMEVDIEEENRRKQCKKEISAKQQQLSEERIRRKRELGLMNDKEAVLKMQEEETQIKINCIESEMKKLEHQIVRQARENALTNYKTAYSKFFSNVITKTAEMMYDQYYKTANQNIVLYFAKHNSEIVSEIETKKNKLEDLIELKENGYQNIELKLSECRAYLRKLENEKCD